MMQARYAEAAREAAWDAAMARTNAAVNRMTSVANQLHQNRNKIESRAGGTYLVIKNTKLKDQGVADRQKYLDAQSAEQRSKFQAMANSGKEYEKDGGAVYTSEFYMTTRDAYQADFVGTSFDGEGVFYSAPPSVLTGSTGPCKRELDTRGVGAKITGPCLQNNTVGYGMNHKMRSEYVQKRLEPVVLEFAVSKVLKDLVERINVKAKSQKDSDVLQARVLSYLIGGKSEGLGIDELSQKVLGEPMTIERISGYLMPKKQQL